MLKGEKLKRAVILFILGINLAFGADLQGDSKGDYIMDSSAIKGEIMSQEITREGSLGRFRGDDKVFSGEVWINVMFKSSPFRLFGGGLVEFSPGARTAWHTHPAGQTLIVAEGEIITGVESGEVSIAHKGDVISCPPNIKHWHGATPKQKATHIALTGEKDGENVIWLEKVSDDEYQKALKQVK